MNSHDTNKPKQPKQPKKRALGVRVLRLTAFLLALGIAAYGALVAYVCYREANVPAPGAYDAIIVLGAQVKPDGQPSVQLRWRLDKALDEAQSRGWTVVDIKKDWKKVFPFE